MPSYAQAFVNEVNRAAEEAHTRMMRGETELFLYFKRGALVLKPLGWNEPTDGYELAMPERIPEHLTRAQLSMRFHDIASRLPILPTD